MWEWLDEMLSSFKNSFSRKATYRWFVVAVLGFMMWREQAGITSFIRELWIKPQHYETMLHFFRSEAWSLSGIRDQWIRLVNKMEVLFCETSMPIRVGDGVKQSKEGKRMPCVKKLFQESENPSKPAYIFGHMFGAIGILAGSASKRFCVPLSITILDGDRQINRWCKSDAEDESHKVSNTLKKQKV